MGETVKDVVFQAFEHRTIKNGQMTTQQMKDILLQSQQEMQTLCHSKSRHFGMPLLWSLVKMLSMVLMMMMVTPFLLMGWMTKLKKLGGPGCTHIAAGCGKLQNISNFQKSRSLSAMTGCCGLLGCLDMR
jgi:hypothetical protein